LAAGLSLLFDTLTFLRTNWSPLHIPMFAANELAIGYVLAVVGAASGVTSKAANGGHFKTGQRNVAWD
jgi:hypothetical protein